MTPIPYSRIASKVFAEPWEIIPSHHEALQSALVQHLKKPEDFALTQPGLAPEREAGRFNHPVQMSDDGRIAILSVEGVMAKRLSWLETMCGCCDLAHLDEDIETLKADDRIETIIFDLHSPGGLARESADTADRLLELTAIKRTVAYSDSVMASAAYKIAASCSAIYGASSVTTGSIGTFISVLDSSKRYEMDGLNLRVFRDGKYKAMGTPGKPLTEEEADYLQSEVDGLSAKFKSFVRSRRPGIREEAMQGQGIDGATAVEMGVMDGIHRDLVSLVSEEMMRLS